jgi:hypothetical protein
VKHGDPCLPPGFWSRVSEDPVTGLWTWTGRVNRYGYGIYRNQRAHRLLFLASGQEILPGWHVGHTCHDEAVAAGLCTGGPTCEHRRCLSLCCLEAQSHRQNILAGIGPTGVNHRKTLAVCGHPYTGIYSSCRRYCAPCVQQRSREQGRTISRAAQTLGLTISQYVTQHGRSTKKAKQILEGATCHLAKIPGGPA